MASTFGKENSSKNSKQTSAYISLTKTVSLGAIKKTSSKQFCPPRSTLQSLSLQPWKLTYMDYIKFLEFWLPVWFGQWEPRQEAGGNEERGIRVYLFPQLPS